MPEVLPRIVRSASAVTTQYPVGEPCHTQLFTPARPEDFPCPLRQRFTGAHVPWAVPQPDQPPCPVCFLLPHGIELGINPDFGGLLSDPVLILHGSFGKKSISLPLQTSDLSPGNTVFVGDLGYDITQVTEANIEFVVNSVSSRMDALLVLP